MAENPSGRGPEATPSMEEILRRMGSSIVTEQRIPVTGNSIVFPGKDPAVLGNTQDPSGFLTQGFTSVEIEGICAYIADAYRHVLSLAPADLAHAAPKQVPVYCGPMGHENIRAQVLYPLSQLTMKVEERQGTRVVSPVGMKVQEPVGLQFHLRPPVNFAAIRNEIYHELFHILTHSGTHSYLDGPTEALTMALERAYAADRSDHLAQHDWDANGIQATTGLLSPDFARTNHSLVTLHALYVSAHQAFSGIAVEQIWQIWSLLCQKGRETGYYPVMADVRAAVLHVLQGQGERVLRSPTFQILRPGLHHIAYPTKEKDHATVYTFAVSQNADYGFNTQNTFQECLFTCQDAKSIYRHILYDKGDCVIQGVNAEGELMPVQLFSYESLAQQVQSAGRDGARLAKRMGGKMGVDIQGLQRIEIRQPRK